MTRIPGKLERPPLIEAVFETRFSSRIEGTAELLPGLMFAALGTKFTIEPSGVGSIPRQLQQQHPELRYAPQAKLKGESETLLIAENSLGFSVERPYPGWERFKARGMEVAAALRSTGLVAKIERFSLKYANVFDTADMAPFAIQIDAAGLRMDESPFQFRFETAGDAFRSIVEFSSRVQVDIRGERISGTLLAIDTIGERDLERFWDDTAVYLERAHTVLETLFFRLLRPETVVAFGPSDWKEI